jgi:hypothetical protein
MVKKPIRTYMSSQDEMLERTDAETELHRRRGDRRNEGEVAPELGERRENDRRRTPGFMGLISDLFGGRH